MIDHTSCPKLIKDLSYTIKIKVKMNHTIKAAIDYRGVSISTSSV